MSESNGDPLKELIVGLKDISDSLEPEKPQEKLHVKNLIEENVKNFVDKNKPIQTTTLEINPLKELVVEIKVHVKKNRIKMFFASKLLKLASLIIPLEVAIIKIESCYSCKIYDEENPQLCFASRDLDKYCGKWEAK